MSATHLNPFVKLSALPLPVPTVASELLRSTFVELRTLPPSEGDPGETTELALGLLLLGALPTAEGILRTSGGVISPGGSVNLS